MRAADRVDDAMFRLPQVTPYARQGIIAISNSD
jgi:hypothetical protein